VAVEQQERKENALVRYVRETRAELRKVHWPTRKETLAMTRIVLIVMIGMSLFLGALDLVFGWLLKEVVSGSPVYMVASVVVGIALLVAIYFVSQEHEGN